MPLVIHLRNNQTAILNGAVIENISGRTISIAVRNEAKVLRSDDMIEPDEAVTPATRVYLALQCAYLVQEPTGEHLAACREQLAGCLAMLPGVGTIAADIAGAIDSGNLYAALKCARALIRHEAALLARDGAPIAAAPQDAYRSRPPAAVRGRVPEGSPGRR